MKNVNILMLDNNIQFLEKTRDFLGGDPFINEVFITTNYSEALRLAEEKKPEFIMLDILMPAKNGIDLIPDFQNCASKAKIFMLTLWDMNGYRNSAIKAGADGVVPKKRLLDELIPKMKAFASDT